MGSMLNLCLLARYVSSLSYQCCFTILFPFMCLNLDLFRLIYISAMDPNKSCP
ncbi:hypothetical protein DsansV1_C28g0206041 [Dioscorea sansibarensis]